MPKEENTYEQRTAVEMAASVGSALTLPDQFWQDLVRFDLSEWGEFLVQSGSWLLNSLDAKIAHLQNLAIEQATAIDLRETFGVPTVELALPVFAELAGMEARARAVLQEEAKFASQMVEQIRQEIMRNLGLFFALQVEKLEEEELAHLQALEAVQKETDGQSTLAEVEAVSETKLNGKLKVIRADKEELLQTLAKFARQVSQQINSAFETTVFKASQQSLEVVSISKIS